MLEVNKVYRGDNLSLIKQLDNNCIDLTVTSPPYDNLREYKGFNWDFEGLAKELFRVTKEGGVVVWIVGDATIQGSETGTSFKQALYFKEIGFNLHDTMIYEKTGCGACGSNKCYIQNFEYMFVLSKGKIKTYNLIYDRENVICGNINTNTNRDICNVEIGRKYRKIETKKLGRRFNIWKVNPTSGNDKLAYNHPAPFPEKLVEDHIISWSNKGDLILDPFMGSGTTAKMALKNERDFIGFELSQEYCDITNERIENLK
jgi:site-specific DNA-methyltransferase (adenine-specific)